MEWLNYYMLFKMVMGKNTVREMRRYKKDLTGKKKLKENDEEIKKRKMKEQ